MLSTELDLVPAYVITEASPPETNYEILDTDSLDDFARRQNRDFYDAVAESYAKERAWNPVNEQAIRSTLLHCVNPYLRSGDKVLVVGAGTGRDQDLLQKMRMECVGVDLSGAMLSQAASRITDHLTQGNASLLPFKNDSFDFVYCEAAGEHMDKNDLALVLPEFKRVIKTDEEREAHVLFSVRLGNGNAVRIYDIINEIEMPKVFATYTSEGINRIFLVNNMKILKQQKSYGGTPRVKGSFPWLNTILRIKF
jgi:ubiquinone/menaquinone biosynthesis C-methylase UbiE